MSKKLNIGINGFGRIGRIATRIILDNPAINLVAVNSRAQSSSHAYLLKYDSSYGTLNYNIRADHKYLTVNNHKIAVLNYQNPGEIPWDKVGADLVIDSTGKFRTKKDLEGHLKKKVKYVVLSAPAKDDTKTIVLGVNEKSFDPERDKIVSNSSCTTNCLATVIKVLDEKFRIENAYMTTIHAVTDSQNLLDNSHKKEERLRRSVLSAMIPASTGSARDIIKLFPGLTGKIICQAVRIPIATVSLINLVANLKKTAKIEAINAAYVSAAGTSLKGILTVSPDKLVSVDYKGSAYSAIVDTYLTSVIAEKFVNLFAWYDNEWGYASRLVDLCLYIGHKSKLI